MPLEAFDPSLWGSGGRSFWQNDTTVEDTAYWFEFVLSGMSALCIDQLPYLIF